MVLAKLTFDNIERLDTAAGHRTDSTALVLENAHVAGNPRLKLAGSVCVGGSAFLNRSGSVGCGAGEED